MDSETDGNRLAVTESSPGVGETADPIVVPQSGDTDSAVGPLDGDASRKSP